MSAPVARTLSGSIALTVAAVPTGMKAGVRISPRGSRRTPVRARPSRAAISKAIPDIGPAYPVSRAGTNPAGLAPDRNALSEPRLYGWAAFLI